jgi:ketosteroid isomerase-like protein
VREWVRDLFEAFDEQATFLVEEILADSEEYVVARVALAGHGGRSGAPLALRFISVVWCKGGKITHTTGYTHRRDAFKAVGWE